MTATATMQHFDLSLPNDPLSMSGDDLSGAEKNTQIFRGKTPANIAERCLDYCRQFIGGRWRTASIAANDITVRRLGGGFSNQLYHIRLNCVTNQDRRRRSQLDASDGEDDREEVDDDNDDDDDDDDDANDDYDNDDGSEPTEVAIKLYERKMRMTNVATTQKRDCANDYERLNDVIALMAASNLDIGPRVYGIFSDGFIQAYVAHEQFRAKHQADAALLSQLAQSLAKIHQLRCVPIGRRDDGNGWLFRTMREWIDFGYEHCGVSEMIDRLRLDAFLRRDLRQEFDEIERLAATATFRSPIVFAHNDFRPSNALVTIPDRRVMIIDMENCAYSPRAYDLATFLAEWGHHELDLAKERLVLPDDQTIESFVRLYVDACDRIMPGYAARSENRITKIIQEVKFYILVNSMFFIALSIKQNETILEAFPYNPVTQMISVNRRYLEYQKLKQRLIDDGTILLENEH